MRISDWSSDVCSSDLIARARFFISEQFASNMDHLKSGAPTADELLTMMIFGLPGKAPSLRDIYEMNAAAWLGARVHVVTYEALIRHVGEPGTSEADEFFGARSEEHTSALPTLMRTY